MSGRLLCSNVVIAQTDWSNMLPRKSMPRLTGISVPLGGLQWEYQESDAVIARRIVSYLEDRRVLFVPDNAEVPAHCIESVVEIRRFLTHELSSANERAHVAPTIRALRAAARKFLDALGPQLSELEYGVLRNGTAGWVFNQALGELRGVFGIHAALLAERYGIEVEPDLASIMPSNKDDDSDWFFDSFRSSKHP